jgi:hypothetical protein
LSDPVCPSLQTLEGICARQMNVLMVTDARWGKTARKIALPIPISEWHTNEIAP